MLHVYHNISVNIFIKTIQVEKLDLVYVPLCMVVSGQPLHFQMVAATPNKKPILRFGTHVAGVGPITRQMRVNNSSPFG